MSRAQSLNKLEIQSAADLNRYVLSLQETLKRFEDLPNLVSSHSLLHDLVTTDNRPLLVRQANIYLEHVAVTMKATDVYVMDATGTTLAASNWRQEQSFVGKNYSFRPYYQDAIQGRNGRYFALGSVSKKRGYYFSYPIKVNGEVKGVTVVKIDLNDIEEEWSDSDQHIIVTDEDGVVFISTRKDWKFRTLFKMSRKDMSRIIASKRYGDQPLREIDIVAQKAVSDDAQLVTVMEIATHINPALDGVEPRQYLMQSRNLPSYGLSVGIMASTRDVSLRVYNAVIISSVGSVALVMLWLFISARRRIKGERERFERD
ncbi:MAG: cache domain-containing protein, partial [Pontibacterium sp.]